MFEIVDRKQQSWLMIFGGWAFDRRIFDTLDLPYNYIFFCGCSTADLRGWLKAIPAGYNIDKISLLGWSRGAQTACDFAAENPVTVEEIILVGARKKYEQEQVEKIKQYLKKNRAAFLYKFYRDCFCAQEKNVYRWFKDRLLKDYLDEMPLEELIDGLDRLGAIKMDLESLKKIKLIKIVHGFDDSIAPVNEAVELAASLPTAKFIGFENTGHLPFLRKDFKRRLYDC